MKPFAKRDDRGGERARQINRAERNLCLRCLRNNNSRRVLFRFQQLNEHCVFIVNENGFAGYLSPFSTVNLPVLSPTNPLASSITAGGSRAIALLLESRNRYFRCVRITAYGGANFPATWPAVNSADPGEPRSGAPDAQLHFS